MNLSSCAIALRGPAIVVELPYSLTRRGNRIAVGLSDDTYKIWKSFFTIAGVKAKKTTCGSIYEWWLSPF